MIAGEGKKRSTKGGCCDKRDEPKTRGDPFMTSGGGGPFRIGREDWSRDELSISISESLVSLSDDESYRLGAVPSCLDTGSTLTSLMILSLLTLTLRDLDFSL